MRAARRLHARRPAGQSSPICRAADLASQCSGNLQTSCTREQYGQALVMSRKWKAALAPWLAGISARTGFAGEFRFGLLNDVRFGERKLPRMIDQMGALALPKDAPPPAEWPLPELKMPAQDIGLLARAAKARRMKAVPSSRCRPGAVGVGKAWPVAHYAELAAALTMTAPPYGCLVGRTKTALAKKIVADGSGSVCATSPSIGFAQRNSRAGRG